MEDGFDLELKRMVQLSRFCDWLGYPVVLKAGIPGCLQVVFYFNMKLRPIRLKHKSTVQEILGHVSQKNASSATFMINFREKRLSSIFPLKEILHFFRDYMTTTKRTTGTFLASLPRHD